MNPETVERLRGFEPKRGTKLAKAWSRDGVRDSFEFRRIFGMPRRALVLPSDTSDLSSALATDDGSLTLKPIQAFALEEAYRVGGLVGSIRVGGGKTLITFLIARACEALRPLLLVPADLVPKTRKDFARYAEHFHVPPELVPRVVSYQWLGRVEAAEALASMNPDKIIADEAQYLKNRRAAVTRRVGRYLHDVPTCKFTALSGTLTTSRIGECAHLYEWALRERSPLPRKFTEVVEWGLAIDERLQNAASRLEAGALAKLMDADDRQVHRTDPVAATRAAVRKRIHDTPGVVATTDDGPACSLRITLHTVEGYNAETEKAFAGLEDWATPSGDPISDAVTKWRHATELANGFYYRWKVEPPREWLTARRAWFAIVRHLIDHNGRDLDSPLQIENAVRAGHYDGQTANTQGEPIGGASIDAVYRTWRDLRDTYEPVTVPVWLDDRMVRFARAWCAEGPGLVWVSHVAMGERLGRDLGLPYYGAKGLDARGRSIDDHVRGTCAIASVHSCGRGRNLQGIWDRNLFTIDTLNAEGWEQAVGRTHREGQEADTVIVDVAVGCAAQVNGFHKAIGEAEYAYQITGQPQKLGYADVVIPQSFPVGPRWVDLK